MARIDTFAAPRQILVALCVAAAFNVAAGLIFFVASAGRGIGWGVAAAVAALGSTMWAGVALRSRMTAVTLAHEATEARAGKAEDALRHLREALDELPSGLEIYDGEDRLIFFNKQMARLYPWIQFERQIGRTFESILRESVSAGRVPAAIGREEQWLAQRLAVRGTREGPLLQSLKSGSWINTYERRSLSNYFVGVRLEVTDLVEKTRELHEGRDRLQAIISSAAVGIVLADARGAIVEANTATLVLFGYTQSEILARPLSDLIPSLALGPAETQPDAAPSGPPVRHAEYDGAARDGSALALHVSVSEIGSAATKQFVVIVVDVTERARAEEARRGLESQLRESQKMESIGTLASGIAHDFNNALGSILGNTDLARDDLEHGATDKALQSIALVHRAAQRARNLVRHILTFSRRQPLQRSVQDLRPIVEEALNILRATLPARVALDKRFADAAVHVLVDAIQIEQVVINLCTNAWQAMESHGGRIEIGVGTARLDAATATRLGLVKGMHAWMWFADDGAGMDDATRLRVFDPFFTTKPLGTGTGLGLSVVHGIVQSHDGAIGVESVLGKGSRFDLYLPLTKARPDDIAPNGPARTVASGHGECVLFIDDDEMMPLMVERLLERAGYAVRCFADPTTAVDAVRARPGDFDVVVTDYNMPKMSGLDVALALSSILPSLPIVLTSGLVTDELRTRARECGVLEVIDKQNSLEELAAAVQRALTLSAGKSPHA